MDTMDRERLIGLMGAHRADCMICKCLARDHHHDTCEVGTQISAALAALARGDVPDRIDLIDVDPRLAATWTSAPVHQRTAEIADRIVGYLGDLADQHADTAMQWMREEVDARLPEGASWQPGEGTVYYRVGAGLGVDPDQVIEAAIEATCARVAAHLF